MAVNTDGTEILTYLRLFLHGHRSHFTWFQQFGYLRLFLRGQRSHFTWFPSVTILAASWPVQSHHGIAAAITFPDFHYFITLTAVKCCVSCQLYPSCHQQYYVFCVTFISFLWTMHTNWYCVWIQLENWSNACVHLMCIMSSVLLVLEPCVLVFNETFDITSSKLRKHPFIFNDLCTLFVLLPFPRSQVWTAYGAAAQWPGCQSTADRIVHTKERRPLCGTVFWWTMVSLPWAMLLPLSHSDYIWWQINLYALMWRG